MTGGGVETALIICSLILAAWCLITTARNRSTDLTHLIGTAVVEFIVLAQVVLVITRLVDGEGPGDLVTFIGYLIMLVVALPASVAWSYLDRSRWGPAVIGVAALIVPVLVVRLQQLWDAPSV